MQVFIRVPISHEKKLRLEFTFMNVASIEFITKSSLDL